MSSQSQCTGMEPTVHLLSYELYVAGFSKDGISNATYSLLQIMLGLFQENSDCRRYFMFCCVSMQDFVSATILN